MYAGGSWPTGYYAFPCQMAGANDYTFVKSGGKGFNCLE